MLDDRPLKVGDELVELGKVYKIFKIADKVTYGGIMEKHIFFKPVFTTSDNHTLSCSVPLSRLKEANIRRPLDKKLINTILKALSQVEAVVVVEVAVVVAVATGVTVVVVVVRLMHPLALCSVNRRSTHKHHCSLMLA